MSEEENREDIPERFNQGTQLPDLMKAIMNPDLSNKERGTDVLTKELKISNIQPKHLQSITDMTDISIQWFNYGATDFSQFLILLRDTFLSGTSSVNGFERNAQISDVRRYEVKESEKEGIRQKLFSRGAK